MLLLYLSPQRPPFLPPPIGNLPPPPGMLFPPGMPPVPTSGNPALNPTEEIWVENKTPEGKVGHMYARCMVVTVIYGVWEKVGELINFSKVYKKKKKSSGLKF